jgi:hypothetical protein
MSKLYLSEVKWQGELVKIADNKITVPSIGVASNVRKNTTIALVGSLQALLVLEINSRIPNQAYQYDGVETQLEKNDINVAIILDEFLGKNDTNSNAWVDIKAEIESKVKTHAYAVSEDDSGSYVTRDIVVTNYNSNEVTFRGEIKEEATGELTLKPTTITIPDGSGGFTSYSDLTGQ